MALRTVRSFLATAAKATFGGLPADEPLMTSSEVAVAPASD
jgi:hypothetical protein